MYSHNGLESSKMYNHNGLESSKMYSHNGLENVKSVQPQLLRKCKNRKYKNRITYKQIEKLMKHVHHIFKSKY